MTKRRLADFSCGHCSSGTVVYDGNDTYCMNCGADFTERAAPVAKPAILEPATKEKMP